MSVLLQATNQWSTRPADQRFRSLGELHAAVQHYKDIAAEAERPYVGMRVGQSPEGPTLVGERGYAKFTHWSFGQLCARVGAPASYLRTLPGELVSRNLNHSLATFRPEDDDMAKLYFTQNGGLTLAALTSPKYTRIFDADITRRLIRLSEQHPEWQPAPAAFDGSRGLYASDHDLFAFMVDNDRRIFDKDPNGGLGRGFFVSNSEVGAASFAITTFFYEYVCGNHRVWGAKGVTELRLRHVGKADDRAFGELEGQLIKYADASASGDEAKVMAMKRMSLGNDKDAVLDKVFGLRIPELSRKAIEQGYDKAVEHESWYGDPRSVWGLTGGITEVARDMVNADERVKLERAAGKVMQIAF